MTNDSSRNYDVAPEPTAKDYRMAEKYLSRLLKSKDGEDLRYPNDANPNIFDEAVDEVAKSTAKVRQLLEMRNGVFI